MPKESFIHRWLILPKLLYFTLNMLVYSLHAFATKFYIKDWGFKAEWVGYMNALQFLNFFGSIFWGQLADKTGKHRTITVLGAFMFCLLNTLLLIHYFDEEKWTGRMWAVTMNTLGMFFLSGLFPMVDAQVISLLSRDGAFSKDVFGKQRLWGSIAHTASTGFSYLLRVIFQNSTGMFVGMNVVGITFIGAVLLAIPGDLKIEMGKHHHHGDDKKKEKVAPAPSPTLSVESGISAASSTSSTGASDPAGAAEKIQAVMAGTPTPAVPVQITDHDRVANPAMTLIKKPAFLFFMTFVLVAGYVRSIMTIYQKYFVADILEMNDESSVFLDIFRLMSEVITFFFSKQIIHICGVYWVLIMSQLSGLLRMLVYGLYGYLPENEIARQSIIYGAELLKGLNTGLIVSAAIKIVTDMAPRGTENTAQGLFSGTYAGLSMAVAGIGGGLLLQFFPTGTETDVKIIDRIRFQGMFLVSTVVCFIVILLFFFKYAFIDRVMFGSSRKNAQHA